MGTGIVNPTQACIECSTGRTRNALTLRCPTCATERNRILTRENLRAIAAARPIRTCLDCSIVVKYPQQCCPVHSVRRAVERSRRSAAAWRRRNPDKVLEQRIRYPRHPTRIIRPALLVYPFIRTARDEHAELLEVNGMVPRGLLGRADVVQEIMLALFEHRETIETVRAGAWRGYIRSFYRANHEAAGQAVSIDVPRFAGGRSLLDTLVAP